MIDPKMIEVIEKRCNQLDYEVPQWWIESVSRAIHDAGFRRVPSEDEIAKAIVDSVPDIKITSSQNGLAMDITATLDTYPIAQAIRKLMLGGE